MNRKVAHGLRGVLSLIILGATTSAASALEPTIYACVAQPGGTLRIVSSTRSCLQNETLLSWNQVGPKGPAGVTGPTGPQGPAGKSGTGFAGVHGTVNANGTIASGKGFTVSRPNSGEYTIDFTMPSSTQPNCLVSKNDLNFQGDCGYSVRSLSTTPATFRLSVVCESQTLYSVFNKSDAPILTKTITRSGDYAAGLLSSEFPLSTPFTFMCMQTPDAYSSSLTDGLPTAQDATLGR